MGSGGAKRTGKALLATVGKLAGKPAQKRLRFLAEIRPRIGGIERAVASFSRDEIVDGAAAITRTTLTGVEVAFNGGAVPASEVMRLTKLTHPDAYLETAVGALLDESRRIDPAAPFNALLGEDWLGTESPVMLSAGERLHRLVEGLITATGQASANGIDPLELLDPPLLTGFVKYIRSHVMWAGWDHGNVFELIRAATFGRLPLRLPPTHQIMLPKLKPPFSLGFGYDTLLEHPDFYLPAQHKAVAFARASLTGNVSLHKIGNRIDSVVGPNALAQKVTDGIRNRVLGHWLPGPGVPRPFPMAPPTNTTGWRRVSPVTVFSLDTGFLIDTAQETVADALWYGRTATIDISRGIDAPSMAKTQLRAIFGGPVIRRDMPSDEFRQLATAWLEGQIPVWEASMNDKLATRKLRDAIRQSATPEVRLVGSHQADRLTQILAALDLLLSTGRTR